MVVGVGGAAGALLRYFVFMILGPSIFPYGTLLVNVIGSLILGLITGYFMNRQKGDMIYLALGTGFCGGFTTMSTFSAEAMELMNHSFTLGILYIGSTVLFGVMACFIGHSIFGRQSGEKQ